MKKTRQEKRAQRPFAKNLKSLMSEKKFTLKQVSSAVDIAPSVLSGWLAGATPEDHLAVKRLAKFFGVSFSFILTGLDDERDLPTITEVFEDGGVLFDGVAKITIQRLVPRTKK